MSTKHSPEPSKHVLLSSPCTALVLHRQGARGTRQQEEGHHLFADWVQQNSQCFWNACLQRAVSSLEYRGCLVPCTLLVSGTDFALEVVRSAWARRVLRPPKGCTIHRLGDLGVLEMSPVPQTQFAPLSEALCKVVSDLNGENAEAAASSIRSRLGLCFPEMQVPPEDILYNALGALIRERKLYHTGGGYFVASPDTYRHRAPPCERPILMTEEEAIVRLHGCSSAAQTDVLQESRCSSSSFVRPDAASTPLQRQKNRDVSCQISQVPPSPEFHYMERSHSLKILRMRARPKSSEGMDRGGSFKEISTRKRLSYAEVEESVHEIPKVEKQSMLSKLLKRMQALTDKSTKQMTFSAQFPPPEWLLPDKLYGHSVATQTQATLKAETNKPEISDAKIPWTELQARGIPRYFDAIGQPKLTFLDTNPNGERPTSVPMRQKDGANKNSPSHRYSHGTFASYAKRRHSRHRRSSSESPKIHKAKPNGQTNPSSGSKSPTDNSDAKVSFSSSGGTPIPANPKAVVNPRLRVENSFASPKKSTYHFTPPSSWDGRRNTPSSASAFEPKIARNSPLYQAKALCSPQRSKKIKDSSSCSPQTINNITPPVVEPIAQGDQKDSVKNAEKKEIINAVPIQSNQDTDDDHSLSTILSDAKLALSESFSDDTSVSCNGPDILRKKTFAIQPLVLKNFVNEVKAPAKVDKKSPPAVDKEVIVDNSVSVEVALEKSPSPNGQKGNNVSTTVVTEETTVTKGKGNAKVVTVTSITTSLSHGGIKNLEKLSPDKSALEDTGSEKEKSPVNNLNIETGKNSRIIDCSSSCNIITEVN